MDVLSQLFERHFHSLPTHVLPLRAHLSGSGRNIIRLANDQYGDRHSLWSARGERRVPRVFSLLSSPRTPGAGIFAEDLDQGAYLEQDLGDTTLYDYLTQNRDGDEIAPEVVEAYRKVVEVLPRFQVEVRHEINYKACYPRTSFDRQSIAWDLNYFKYYFLRLAGIPFNEQALENDFARLTRFLLSADRDYFLYRDFQSRNVMLVDGDPFFVDYQGGRKGALQYDIASLLFDAKADLPPEPMVTAGHLAADLGDPARARLWAEKAARLGCSTAMYNIGVLDLKDGKPDAAAEMFRRAAEAGNHSGYAALAELAERNDNIDESRHWARVGASVDEPWCLQRHAENLIDTDRQDVEAYLPLLERAGAQGNVDAMVQAGIVYHRVLRNDSKSLYWLERAQGMGDADAAKKIEDYGLRPAAPFATTPQPVGLESYDAQVEKSNHRRGVVDLDREREALFPIWPNETVNGRYLSSRVWLGENRMFESGAVFLTTDHRLIMVTAEPSHPTGVEISAFVYGDFKPDIASRDRGPGGDVMWLAGLLTQDQTVLLLRFDDAAERDLFVRDVGTTLGAPDNSLTRVNLPPIESSGGDDEIRWKLSCGCECSLRSGFRFAGDQWVCDHHGSVRLTAPS